MKTFVTKEFMQSSAERIRGIEKELERIRKEKNNSFDGDTNAWLTNILRSVKNRIRGNLSPMLRRFHRACIMLVWGDFL